MEDCLEHARSFFLEHARSFCFARAKQKVRECSKLIHSVSHEIITLFETDFCGNHIANKGKQGRQDALFISI
jgi:hypothetical protein